MPRETIRPRKVAWRLIFLSKCIPKAINYTPTTTNQSNTPEITPVGPQEHPQWHHEEPPKYIAPHLQITIIHYTTNHGPHLARHKLPHQD